MIILDYDRKKHEEIIHACALALKDGKAVVYPTDTTYGLAVNMANKRAVKRLYQIKGRDFNKLTHVTPPSLAFAQKMGVWSQAARKLAQKFWPGPLTIIIPQKNKKSTIGLRYPQNKIALDLANKLGQPISATSANISGQPDSRSLNDILRHFEKARHKPDIIINAGRLLQRKPSTLVKISGKEVEILRRGPITGTQIKNFLK
jgi:L-threonylcarbamoyladenylate synthase